MSQGKKLSLRHPGSILTELNAIVSDNSLTMAAGVTNATLPLQRKANRVPTESQSGVGTSL